MKDVYSEKLDLIRVTTACENTQTATALISKLAPIANCNMSIGDFFRDPCAGGARLADYFYEIEQKSISITALHNHLFYNILYPLGEVWFSHIRQPGVDISENAAWQIVEFNNMTKSDYTELCSLGYEGMKERLLPKAFEDKYEGYLEYKDNFYTNRNIACEYLKIRGFFDISNIYPFVTAPFEMLSGARGVRNFFLDCYTDINMVKATVDAIWPGVKEETIERINSAKASGQDYFGLMVGCWRSSPAIINHKLFSTLVWPYLKDIGEAIIDQGVVPIYHLDMNWLRELEAFRELPERKIIINIDGATDIIKAREILGPNYCILGGVPGTLLISKDQKNIDRFVENCAGKVGGKGIFWGCGCETPATAQTDSFIRLFRAIGRCVK